MAAPAPPRPVVAIARPSRTSKTNGMLHINPSSARKGLGSASSQASKAPSARLKIVIRRLPPGLTEAEFCDIMGSEWKLSAGRVDWMSYKEGKVSKDAAKPSRPSRAYLYLVEEQNVQQLSQKVKASSFVDAKGTQNDPSLLGPPTVDFAPYPKTPNRNTRNDGRQGTIDQDPEFIDFLQSLTNPITKPVVTEVSFDNANKETQDSKVTPLVQYLKEKKANKGKEPKSAEKMARTEKPDGKEGRPGPKFDAKNPGKAQAKDSPTIHEKSTSALRVEKLARDAVKQGNKHASSAQAPKLPAPSPTQSTGPATPTTATLPTAPASTSTPAPATERKRERINISGAARILRRDLALAGATPTRRRRETTKGAPAATSAATPTFDANTSTSQPQPQASASPGLAIRQPQSPPSAPAQPVPAKPPTGPAATRSTQKHAPRNTSANTVLAQPQSQPSTQASQPSATAKAVTLTNPVSTQAFLKHANASAGINESNLQEKFSAFGTVKSVEIDRKKGFAYVDFDSAEALKSAIEASPVAIAQGSVVVLERILDRKGRKDGGGAARGGPGRGGPAGHAGSQRGGTAQGPGGGRGASGPPPGPHGGKGRGGARGRGRGGSGGGGRRASADAGTAGTQRPGQSAGQASDGAPVQTTTTSAPVAAPAKADALA